MTIRWEAPASSQRRALSGLIPPPTRVGQYRAFCLRDLPVIERAARQYGYIGKAPVMVEA